jgi:hypothetical protein
MTKSVLSVSVFSLLLAACSGAAHPQASSVAHEPDCRGGSIHSDAELARFEHCVAVEGDLQVSGVRTLKSLASLREVTGTLEIGPTEQLVALAGLERLEAVGTLVLTRNRALIDARALNGLDRSEHVRVGGNPRLSKSFGFLEGLPVRDAKLELSHNIGLEAEGLRPAGQAKHVGTLASLDH